MFASKKHHLFNEENSYSATIHVLIEALLQPDPVKRPTSRELLLFPGLIEHLLRHSADQSFKPPSSYFVRVNPAQLNNRLIEFDTPRKQTESLTQADAMVRPLFEPLTPASSFD